MQPIPVIVGFGGVNAAGRSSGHHGYRRTVVDALGAERAGAMWRSLAGLSGHQGPLEWTQDENGLMIQLPETKPCEHAFAFKILP